MLGCLLAPTVLVVSYIPALESNTQCNSFQILITRRLKSLLVSELLSLY